MVYIPIGESIMRPAEAMMKNQMDGCSAAANETRCKTGRARRRERRVTKTNRNKELTRHNVAASAQLMRNCTLFLGAEVHAGALAHFRQVQQQRIGVEEHAVRRVRDRVRDLARRLDLTQRQEGGVLLDGLADELGTGGLTLRAHDGALLLLQRLLDDELGALRVLLRDLRA